MRLGWTVYSVAAAGFDVGLSYPAVCVSSTSRLGVDGVLSARDLLGPIIDRRVRDEWTNETRN